MESVCPRGVAGAAGCEVRVLVAALHAAQLYCSALAAALICCCAPRPHHTCQPRWRGQNLRGLVSLVLCVTWACGAAAAALRPMSTTRLVGATLAPLAWLGAEVLHVALWTRHAATPLIYLSIYWMLAAASSVAILKQQFSTGDVCATHIETYLQVTTVLMGMLLSGVDFICFYDEVTKRLRIRQKYSTEFLKNVTYKQNTTHFYSKITLFWLNSFLYRGYESPLESDDMGELPDNEKPEKYCEKVNRLYKTQESKNVNDIRNPNLWRCYMRMVWPNFYIAGVMKLFGDLIGVVPPLGLAAIINFIEQPDPSFDTSLQVGVDEFCSNGYVMLLLITLALIIQALLSQNSTNLVTVEGIRLKTALQGFLYDKSMRLASWSPETDDVQEESPLINSGKSQNIQSGLLTNLVSQDTYNIMSCVWVCHYTWAIPLKVTAILYLLYTKLGISAIVGSATSILIITPLQFYIGKKLSDNSKDISKCTDHRISKMTEILQGMNIIKLYVWEDLFKEKILHLREVELKHLNKDSIYWSILTFTTQLSTIVITVITFTVYYYLESNSLSATNVFAGLALFNQLSVPLLILPVTVLMVIQAMVSTQRIEEFLSLPESTNIAEYDCDNQDESVCRNKFNDAFIEAEPQDDPFPENEARRDESEECDDHFSDDEILPLTDDRQEYIVRFRNAAFSWGTKSDVLLEIDDLDIPSGKLIMVVGSTGSGKSSLLSAVLGEMYVERGDVDWNGPYSAWYAGQPPWLLECSVRDNIVMDSPWCARRYNRVLRATGLQPDLQLLPDGDGTRLGRGGAPLSGGQRVRVCVARALYSRARLLALDEPLGALDATLARRLVARALLPAARRGLTVMLATNRLELLHYADLVIAMEDGRISGFGRATGTVNGVLARWMELATEARVCAARGTVGPPGGSARERSRLAQALTRKRFQTYDEDDTMIGIKEAAGSHLLPEVPTRAGGSWRRTVRRPRRRPPLTRQLSSPPPSLYNAKCRRDVRRAVSVDASNTVLRREASLLRRLLQMRPQTQNTLTRFTPKTLRRMLTTDSSEDTQNNDKEKEERIGINTTHNILTESNRIDASYDVPLKDKVETETDISEWRVWWEYGRACGWWGAVFWAAAAGAQALAVTADCWLAHATSLGATAPLTDQQKWDSVRIYGGWSCASAVVAGVAGCAAAGAGGKARRALHYRLLDASLLAPLHHHAAHPLGLALHRFSGDILVLDKKLQTAVSRWAQLALLCTAAILVCVVAAPWALLALLPAILIYFMLQAIYLSNARELQRVEASSAGAVVSLCGSTLAGASCVRAGRLQPHMRAALHSRLATNHLATLLLNAANRWLSLTLDLVGAASVVVCVGIAMWNGGSGAGVGLAGAYSLLLPTFLAHLAKTRADLDLQLAALERVITDSRLPQEDYRDDCPIPVDWQRNGKIEFQNVTVQESGGPPILHNISLSIAPGEKVAICGRSGSGKSTLLLSCVGAARIVTGRVLVDGQDARRVPLRPLRHRLVVLPQDAPIFTGTLRENLDPLAVHTDEEIWLSLKAVGLYDFVNAQPAGLECSVSGACRGWSAGRRGRAGSARAALRAHFAAALLLDEPAAALDAPAERALLHNMHKHAPHTTILAVLHRMSSVRGFDRVVVLEEGRIVEQGPTSTLLAQSGSRLARMLAAAHREV